MQPTDAEMVLPRAVRNAREEGPRRGKTAVLCWWPRVGLGIGEARCGSTDWCASCITCVGLTTMCDPSGCGGRG